MTQPKSASNLFVFGALALIAVIAAAPLLMAAASKTRPKKHQAPPKLNRPPPSRKNAWRTRLSPVAAFGAWKRFSSNSKALSRRTRLFRRHFGQSDLPRSRHRHHRLCGKSGHRLRSQSDFLRYAAQSSAHRSRSDHQRSSGRRCWPAVSFDYFLSRCGARKSRARNYRGNSIAIRCMKIRL